MNKLNKNNLMMIESRFKSVQKNIENKLNSLNKKSSQRDAELWNRKQGGGGKSISLYGDIIEKAAVNFSSISGNKLPVSSLATKSKLKHYLKFQAVGVSVISHPLSPYCPTSHMNIRIFFEIGKNSIINNWWIGGGFDLTPYAISKKDALLWHNEAKLALDEFSFPKSRSIKQLIFYLKYFILIREWFKESQNAIPEHIDETIYYLGQGYAFIWQNTGSDFLFNGNNISNNEDLDNYLRKLGYKFNNEDKEFGGYTILKNKKISLMIDSGPSPEFKFSQDYQSGALSFEIISNGKKLISNCGYYKKDNNKLNHLSKSSATQNTLVIDDNSSCKFWSFCSSITCFNLSLCLILSSFIFSSSNCNSIIIS